MAGKGRKPNQFSEFLAGRTPEELNQILVETQAAIRLHERENSQSRKKEKAIQRRNKLQWTKPAYFNIRGKLVSGMIQTIGEEKVRLKGHKNAFSILNLIDEDEAKRMAVVEASETEDNKTEAAE